LPHVVTQCNPVIPVLTPLGKGVAVFLRTDEFTAEWQVFQLDTGESWWWDNPLIRWSPSISDHHVTASPIVVSDKERAELTKRGYDARSEKDIKGS
jgi:hypothetical protein